MKKLIVILAALGALGAHATGKPVKTYSEEEYLKKVAEEVRKRVDDIKNKSVTELTKELVDKEEALRLRAVELTKREDQLKINGAELEKRIKSFEERQHGVLGCVEKNDEEARGRLAAQVDVVANMQPAKAAQLLSVQEPDIAVRILQMLDPKKASKIFNLMDKEVSARLQKQYLNMKR